MIDLFKNYITNLIIQLYFFLEMSLDLPTKLSD